MPSEMAESHDPEIERHCRGEWTQCHLHSQKVMAASCGTDRKIGREILKTGKKWKCHDKERNRSSGLGQVYSQ